MELEAGEDTQAGLDQAQRPHLSAVDSSDSEQEREPAGVAPDAAKAWGAKRFAAKVVSEGVCSSVG